MLVRAGVWIVGCWNYGTALVSRRVPEEDGAVGLPSETKAVWLFLSLKSDPPTIRSIPMAVASPALSWWPAVNRTRKSDVVWQYANFHNYWLSVGRIHVRLRKKKQVVGRWKRCWIRTVDRRDWIRKLDLSDEEMGVRELMIASTVGGGISVPQVVEGKHYRSHSHKGGNNSQLHIEAVAISSECE